MVAPSESIQMSIAVLLSPDSLEAVALAKGVVRPFPNLGKAPHDGIPVSEEEFLRLLGKSAAKA